MATSSTATPTSTAKTAAPATSAMAAMAAAVFSTPESPISKPAAPQQLQRKTFPRRTSAFNDAALLRIFAEKDPLNAPHGTKGAAWDDVGTTLAREPGEERVWTGPACRTRIYTLLDAYDAHRSGRKTPQVIRQLNPSALKVLERTLKQLAKSRVERVAHGEDKDEDDEGGRGPAKSSTTTSTVAAQAVRPTAAAPATAPASMTEAAQATPTSQEPALPAKATVVAKRRRRKGVKTKEQKRATAAMFEAMRHSREVYLNQLRVETAAQAAAKEKGDSPAKPLQASAKPKHTPDVDLSMLRAVVRFSPPDAEELAAVKLQWQAVADQVMRHCGLKFTQTAIRDRCDALLEDFERNDRKFSTYSSGVAVADEERLKLLRMLYKAHKKRRRQSLDKPVVSQGMQSSAIEIDDESHTPEELDEEDDEEEKEREEQIIQETDEDDEEPEALPVASRKRPRPESHGGRGGGGASPDADPAAEMEFDLENDDANLNSQDSTESHDYTPRKHKHQRPGTDLVNREEHTASTDGGGSGPLGAVLDAMATERHERRVEFRAMLDLMKIQMNDNRSKWEREHAQRTREQNVRQQESSALMELLNREREDRKREVAALMTTISKERDDRRNEFMVMMNLITKMIDSKPAADTTAK